MSDDDSKLSATRRGALGAIGGLGLASVLSTPASAASTTISQAKNTAECILPVSINDPRTQLDEISVSDKGSFFNHHFARPNTPDSKNWSVPTGSVTKQGAEVELDGSTATLETTQRGNYPPGKEAIPGAGFRLTGIPTAGEGKAGYFNGSNGIAAGEDATDSFVSLLSQGTEEKIYRSDWNEYSPSERVWVSDYPIITRFPHLYYGEGPAEVRAQMPIDGDLEIRTLHRFEPAELDTISPDGPLFEQPNQPITFKTDGISGGKVRASAAHYEIGQKEGETRINGVFVPQQGDTAGYDISQNSWTHIVSYRKRSGWEGVNIKPLKIAIAAINADVRLALHLDTSPSGGTWSLPENTSGSETAVEVKTDSSVSLASGDLGEQRWVGYASAGQGSNSGDADAVNLDFNLPADQTVSLVGSAVDGTNGTVVGSVGWEEFF